MNKFSKSYKQLQKKSYPILEILLAIVFIAIVILIAGIGDKAILTN